MIEPTQGNGNKVFTRTSAKRSIPPASPHRAGHYAGLHPEDQPYQSTLITIVRPPSPPSQPTPPTLPHTPLPPFPVQQEVDDLPIIELAQEKTIPVPEQYSPVLPHPPQHPSLHPPTTRFNTPLPPPRYNYLLPGESKQPGPPILRKRVVTTTVTIVCLLLLVVGSSLAYIFINKPAPSGHPALSVTPSQLRVGDNFSLSGHGFGANDLISFTYDQHNASLLDGNGKPLQAHADDTGAFSVQVTVPYTWAVGQHSIYALDIGKGQGLSVVTTITIEKSSSAPPLLQLASTMLDLGSGGPGTVSHKQITLTNAGGRHVDWQASSDQAWLTVTPSSGTFYGSSTTDLVVNRVALTPQKGYTGHITFIQQGDGSQPLTLTLTVTMNVIPAPPASLTANPVSLTYSGTSLQNPAAQVITLQNGSSQALDWGSAIITGDGANWLSIYPASGHLAQHSSVLLTASVQSQQLAVGTYEGTIGFKGGTNPLVMVTLYVLAPGNMIASPPSLNFTASGQNPAAQTITLQNSGGSTLAWSVTASTVDGASWLLPTPASGYLAPGQAGTITVNVNTTKLVPRSYQGMLTFSYGSGITRQVSVSLTVSVPLAPSIKLNQNALSFSSILGTNSSSQTFTIANTGNATLHWSISEDQNGSSFAPLTPTKGSLPPAQNAVITVTPNVAQLKAGTYTTNITISDSDSGTKVPSQKIIASIVVKDQAVISVGTNAMTFNVSNLSQPLVVTNSGSQPLNWSAESSASWLTADSMSGTINPSGNIILSLTGDNTVLPPGTFTAYFVIKDTDSGTPVTPQTVTITFIVS